VKLGPDRAGEGRNDFPPLVGKMPGAPEQFLIQPCDLSAQPLELSVTLFQALQPALGLLTEGDDFPDGGAVLAAQRMQEIDSFLELAQSDGVDIDLIRIS